MKMFSFNFVDCLISGY